MIDLSQARSLAPGNCIAEAPCQVIKNAKFCATPGKCSVRRSSIFSCLTSVTGVGREEHSATVQAGS